MGDNSRQNSVTELNQDVGTKKNRRSKKRIELKKDKDKKLIRTSSTETDMTETRGHTKKRKEKYFPPLYKTRKKEMKTSPDDESDSEYNISYSDRKQASEKRDLNADSISCSD